LQQLHLKYINFCLANQFALKLLKREQLTLTLLNILAAQELNI